MRKYNKKQLEIRMTIYKGHKIIIRSYQENFTSKVQRNFWKITIRIWNLNNKYLLSKHLRSNSNKKTAAL